MDSSQYLSTAINRLKQKEYHIQENIKLHNFTLDYVAKRTVFDTQRFGAFFNTYFLFSMIRPPEKETLKAFSHECYNYAKKEFRLYLPPILFWGLRCFPVAIVDSISNEVKNYVSFSEPPRHFGAFEKLVVFSLDTQMIYFYTPSSATYFTADMSDSLLILEMLSIQR